MRYRFVRISTLLLHIYIAVTVLQPTGEAASSTSVKECVVHKAEECFSQLFQSMPICEEAAVTFRCQHYKVLDECFHQSAAVCSPSVIGHTAKAAYRKTVVACARHAGKKYRNAPKRIKNAPTIRRQSSPSELQFISLFGYLQTQCTAKSYENCTNSEFTDMIASCESDIRQQTQLANSDLDRHQLLRTKLDASSRLLQYVETNRVNECLMIRAALSEIFDLQRQYCFQTIVTKCMCSRLNFDHFCGVNCPALEASALPLDQRISWSEFRGRLTGGIEGLRGHLTELLILLLFAQML
jgi:hypothetical protein